MKKIALLLSMILFIISLSSSYVHAEEQVAVGEPDTYEELGDYIKDEFAKTHIPAMSVEIVDAQGIVFAQSYGDEGNLNSPYILGSISKSFTAVAIMQLVEQGNLELEKPIFNYLPSIDKNCKTTVKPLLNQTSGINTYMTLENYKTSDSVTDWEYANVNYNLLGQIVENVSGMSYADYITAYIFKPLEMTNSYVSLEAAKQGDLISGYRNYFGFMVRQEMPYPQSTTTGWMTQPAAYLISTANDMGKYLQFYLNGGQGLLSPESIKEMHTDTVFAATDYEYGYGWGADNRTGETLLCHGGNVENYSTYMFMLPERGLAAIVLFNACDYLVANSMAVQLPLNIAYKLMGSETQDIGLSTYSQSHFVIDAVLLAILLVSVLPLFRLKKWCTKNREKFSIRSIVFDILIHAFLPTLLLTCIALLGIPMSVVSRFAPDIFIVQIVSGLILYVTGAFKVVYRIRRIYLNSKRVEFTQEYLDAVKKNEADTTIS